METKQNAILSKLYELQQNEASIDTADKLLIQYQDELYDLYKDRRLTIMDIDWEDLTAQPQWAQGMAEATFFIVSMLTTIGMDQETRNRV